MNETVTTCRAKAVVLFSGGLDSILASELLRRAGVEVVLLSCHSVFSPMRSEAGYVPPCPIIRLDISRTMVELVKNPQYGRGKNANPCLDCKQMMYGLAWRTAQRLGADFIATGEVLGQRPMSQRGDALRQMENDSPAEGRIVRPLCGKLLPPTIPEQEGLIDREVLLDISGRSRKRQMELAALWGIRSYPTPAGGCKLTDPQFGQRVLKLLDAGLLTVGTARAARHGRLIDLGDGCFALVGRNHEDNAALLRDAPDGAVALELENHPGPVACVIGRADRQQVEHACRLVIEYSRFKDRPTSEVRRVSVDRMRWENSRARER